MKYCPHCATSLTESLIHGRLRPTCAACGFVHYAGPKVAVGVILENNGCILLNRRAIDPGKGRWSFPSGYVDLGESTDQAAVREVKEETGLDVQIQGLIGVYSAASRPVVFVVYAAEIVGGAPVDCDEVEAVELFPVDALPSLAFDHDHRIVNDWRRWRASHS